ncbi:MAG: energy transducer TonB, partial [Sphingomonadaceae bacterium]
MSYVDQGMSGGRIASIIFVAILHALIGYALITGLAYRAVKKAASDLKIVEIEEPPPPPEETPPPPEPAETPTEPPPVVAPPPIVRTQVPPPPSVRTVDRAPPA